MPISQNGWETINGSSLDRSPIPGTDVVPVPGLRPGDVATVLLEVGRQFNQTVAGLYNPGCWGYAAPVPIPGSNIISNHGSGTAIDFNAPSFPWKTRSMTSAQRQACRAIVSNMDGVVAWGGDYTTFIDEMHFEIIGLPSEVHALANKIKGDDGNMPTNYQTALIYAQSLLFRDMPREEYEKYHAGKSRNQLFDDFNNSPERREKLARLSAAVNSDQTGSVEKKVLTEALARAAAAEAKVDKVKEVIK